MAKRKSYQPEDLIISRSYNENGKTLEEILEQSLKVFIESKVRSYAEKGTDSNEHKPS